MSQFPITATRQPRPSFFRGRHARTLSSSSLSDQGDSTPSESSSSDDEATTDFDEAFDSRVRRNSDRSHRSLSISPGAPSPGFASAGGATASRRSGGGGGVTLAHFGTPASKRQHLKLSLSLLRTRQSLTLLARSEPANNPTIYDSLATSLKALSLALPSDLGTLGVFLPILYRLAKDLIDEFKSEAGRRVERRSLSKEEAKRLVGLRQRWCTGEGGKGKGRERDGGEADWVAEIVERVERNPPPSFLASPYDTPSTALLNGIESLLLPSSLPRFGLSDLGLTSEYLDEWEILGRAPEVLAWYLSFESGTTDEKQRKEQATRLLSSVRSLDLSKNQLHGGPFFWA
ncbi:hypothetical protein RQP46_000188 [Phenoliferia psychrophenolica]